jgi:hypothetical protein
MPSINALGRPLGFVVKFQFFPKVPKHFKMSLEGSSMCLKAIERSDNKIYAFRIENFNCSTVKFVEQNCDFFLFLVVVILR